MNFSLTPIAWAIVAASVLAGAYFVIDAIGDRREAKVRLQFAEAARAKNVEIGEFNSADELIAAIRERAVTEAELRARGVAGQCPATEDQAAAITAIRRAK